MFCFSQIQFYFHLILFSNYFLDSISIVSLNYNNQKHL